MFLAGMGCHFSGDGYGTRGGGCSTPCLVLARQIGASRSSLGGRVETWRQSPSVRPPRGVLPTLAWVNNAPRSLSLPATSPALAADTPCHGHGKRPGGTRGTCWLLALPQPGERNENHTSGTSGSGTRGVTRLRRTRVTHGKGDNVGGVPAAGSSPRQTLRCVPSLLPHRRAGGEGGSAPSHHGAFLRRLLQVL